MRMDKHAGHLSGVNTLFFKGFNNDIARFPFILAINFRLGHFASAGNRTVEIVGMGGSRRRNRLTRLRPDSRVARMGVYDAADSRKCLVQQTVGWRIGRRFLMTFNDFTGLQADHHHIVSGHDAIIDAGRLNHQYAAFAIDGANVTR